MIPVYICDDEAPMRQTIAEYVQKQAIITGCDVGPIHMAQNAKELLTMMPGCEGSAVYFLDVDLYGEELAGFALATELRKRDPRGYIIFVTGHEELCFETFRYRLEAMDYIVKGNEEEVQRRIRGCLEMVCQRLQNEPASQSRYFTVKIFDTLRHIPVQSILFFEAVGQKHLVRVHMEEEVVEFFGSLQAVEDELGQLFFRTHRAYLVNRKHIAKIHFKTNVIELDNGSTCLLSRSAKKGLQQNL